MECNFALHFTSYLSTTFLKVLLHSKTIKNTKRFSVFGANDSGCLSSFSGSSGGGGVRVEIGDKASFLQEIGPVSKWVGENGHVWTSTYRKNTCMHTFSIDHFLCLKEATLVKILYFLF